MTTSERERAEFEARFDISPDDRNSDGTYWWAWQQRTWEGYQAGAEAARREERKRCAELAQTYLDEGVQLNRLLSALDKETA